jgi:hippurate hydrolase
VSTGAALSSVTAVLRGGRPGETVLLRADMDALPITEPSGLEFSSQHPGNMHACGHDLHVAMLVGAARLLCEQRESLAGNVVFMFQPGEEGHGGAALMLEEGVLNASGSLPAAAYALHVTTKSVLSGIFTTRPGKINASCDSLEVTLRGKGGHGGSPHRALDPIPAMCEVVTALQVLVTRRFDAFDPLVLTVGKILAGTQGNVIPDDAFFEATLRTFSAETRERAIREATSLVESIARAHGLTADVRWRAQMSLCINDAHEVAFVRSVVDDVFGEEQFVLMDRPTAGSEDFGLILERVPGAFIRLGACPPELDPGTAAYNHSPAVRFDEEVLVKGATLLAELAYRHGTLGSEDVVHQEASNRETGT